MSTSLRNVALDCPEPRALAEFYRQLLGWEYEDGHEDTDPDGDDWLVLRPPTGLPRLAFQRSDGEPPPPWPGARRVHLDLGVPDLEAAVEHAVALGARRRTGDPADEGHPDDPFVVLTDPAGHAFCLVRAAS